MTNLLLLASPQIVSKAKASRYTRFAGKTDSAQNRSDRTCRHCFTNPFADGPPFLHEVEKKHRSKIHVRLRRQQLRVRFDCLHSKRATPCSLQPTYPGFEAVSHTIDRCLGYTVASRNLAPVPEHARHRRSRAPRLDRLDPEDDLYSFFGHADSRERL